MISDIFTTVMLLFTEQQFMILRLLVYACGAAFVYWLTPHRWRLWSLAGLSIGLLVLQGASLEFVCFVLLLALLTHIATQPEDASAINSEQHDRKISRSHLHQLLAFGYLLLLLVALVIAAGSDTFLALTPHIVLRTALLFTSLGILGRLLPPFLTRLSSQMRGAAAIFIMFTSLAAVVTWFEPPSSSHSLGMLLTIGHYVFATGLSIHAWRLVDPKKRRWLIFAVMLVILLAFVLLKTPGMPLIGLASWLGFSYLSFRLLHVLIDRLNGITIAASPLEMVIYALFFPAQAVGPIDRLPRFLDDLRAMPAFQVAFVVEGLTRICLGCVKKFFIADVLLSRIALDSVLLPNITTIYAWQQLYGYALFLFLDFSGYVDIALGMARMVGFTLPENFDAPYSRPNITQFWQAWHITLTHWLRTYIFLPVTRHLLKTRLKVSPLLITLIAQMTIMLLVGLWHGITLNFALWGIYHGVCLFIHKIFADNTRRWQLRWKKRVWANRITTLLSIVFTFHVVAIGWVFFALPKTSDSLQFLQILFHLPR